MNAGETQKSYNIRSFGLTGGEKQDILAFLYSLVLIFHADNSLKTRNCRRLVRNRRFTSESPNMTIEGWPVIVTKVCLKPELFRP